MQKNTEKNKKIAPVICAAAVVLLMLGYIAIFVWAMLSDIGSMGMVAVIVAIYTVILGAIIVGVLVALHQRLREIEGGEEDDARKY